MTLHIYRVNQARNSNIPLKDTFTAVFVAYIWIQVEGKLDINSPYLRVHTFLSEPRILKQILCQYEVSEGELVLPKNWHQGVSLYF